MIIRADKLIRTFVGRTAIILLATWFATVQTACTVYKHAAINTENFQQHQKYQSNLLSTFFMYIMLKTPLGSTTFKL